MTSAIAPMKPTPDHPGGPAGAGDPGLVAAAEREPDPHRRRLAEAERDHEGQRRDLQRDGMRRDRGRADPAHEISGEREHAHFERHRDADRPARAGPSPASAADRTATSGRTGGSGGTAGRATITAISAPHIDRARSACCRRRRRPGRARASPKRPKISDQLSSALSAIPTMLSHSTIRGRSSADDEVAQQLEQQPRRGAPHVGAKEGLALARELRRIWPNARIRPPTCHSSSQ